ncbi:unnamed protein product [Chrysoparadoxa australica]
METEAVTDEPAASKCTKFMCVDNFIFILGCGIVVWSVLVVAGTCWWRRRRRMRKESPELSDSEDEDTVSTVFRNFNDINLRNAPAMLKESLRASSLFGLSSLGTKVSDRNLDSEGRQSSGKGRYSDGKGRYSGGKGRGKGHRSNLSSLDTVGISPARNGAKVLLSPGPARRVKSTKSFGSLSEIGIDDEDSGEMVELDVVHEEDSGEGLESKQAAAQNQPQLSPISMASLADSAAPSAADIEEPWIQSIFMQLGELQTLLFSPQTKNSINCIEISKWAHGIKMVLAELDALYTQDPTSIGEANAMLVGYTWQALADLSERAEAYREMSIMNHFISSARCQELLSEADTAMNDVIQQLQLGDGAPVVLHLLSVSAPNLRIDSNVSTLVAAVEDMDSKLEGQGGMQVRLSSLLESRVTPPSPQCSPTKRRRSSSADRRGSAGMALNRDSSQLDMQGVLESVQISEADVKRISSMAPTGIGRGQFSEIHKICIRPVPGQVIGKQVVLDGLRPADLQTLYVNLAKEICAIKPLRHPLLVEMKGVVASLSKLTLVMELVPQGSLREKIDLLDEWAQVPLSVKEEIMKDIAEGMQFLHSQQVLHGALKAGNVLLTKDMKAKLTDYGLAATNKVLGKLPLASAARAAWEAPEVLEGKKKRGKASDVYSFAVVVWEMLSSSGESPWEGLSGEQVAEKVCKGERLELESSVGDRYRPLVVACWDESPEKRPAFHQVVQRLEDIDMGFEDMQPAHSLTSGHISDPDDSDVEEPHVIITSHHSRSETQSTWV